mmetsp:Transcript_69837/g.175953  ORF Transcript_69837/g.175953 Transcript_69837/m.175953 type:complete len:87 (+) Transcript_69837:139-399(+)
MLVLMYRHQMRPSSRYRERERERESALAISGWSAQCDQEFLYRCCAMHCDFSAPLAADSLSQVQLDRLLFVDEPFGLFAQATCACQ